MESLYFDEVRNRTNNYYRVKRIRDRQHVSLRDIFQIARDLSGYPSSMLRKPEQYSHKSNYTQIRKCFIYFAFQYSDCTVKLLAEYLETTDNEIFEVLADDISEAGDSDFIELQNKVLKRLKTVEYYDKNTGEFCTNPYSPFESLRTELSQQSKSADNESD